jgi:hypothetical protein
MSAPASEVEVPTKILARMGPAPQRCRPVRADSPPTKRYGHDGVRRERPRARTRSGAGIRSPATRCSPTPPAWSTMWAIARWFSLAPRC